MREGRKKDKASLLCILVFSYPQSPVALMASSTMRRWLKPEVISVIDHQAFVLLSELDYFQLSPILIPFLFFLQTFYNMLELTHSIKIVLSYMFLLWYFSHLQVIIHIFYIVLLSHVMVNHGTQTLESAHCCLLVKFSRIQSK